MTRLHIYILLWLLMALGATPARAQVSTTQTESEEDDREVATGVLPIDSLGHDSIAMSWPQAIQRHIDHLLKSDMFTTSQVGLMVYDLTADSVIYKHNERQMMRPASTMKLLTAIAAIDRLGGSYQFKTELCYTGKIENNTLTGDVYCVGGMDPKFNSDDMAAFVESIHKMGVDTIRGHLYADKSMKDFDTLGEGWCWDDKNPTLTPLLYSRKDKFMERFEADLRKAGIVVQAFSATADKPDSAYCICARYHTIDQILMQMMKESDNLYAEALFYQIAASGGDRLASARQARAYIRRLIDKTALKGSQYRIADGSGLSLYNYVSAELEVRLLRYAYKYQNIYLHLLPSLPKAGVDGTLRKRMKGVFTKDNVRAKTGSVTGVYSLAGYCTASNGHQLCFAILNQGVMHSANARSFQDRVCEVLCAPQ